MPVLDIAAFPVLLLLCAASACPFFSRLERFLIPVAFSLATVASFAAALAGFLTVKHGLNSAATIALGLPGLPFNIRLDPLAGFFLVVIGLLSSFVSIYSIGYVGKETQVALRAYRPREGLTQKQLAELTGIPRHHISEMENAKRSIGKERAKKLADALKLVIKEK
jgi:formate hydrogenlyase subunit 3/multisubunit Na+/H+ antiporter MnhD subunit